MTGGSKWRLFYRWGEYYSIGGRERKIDATGARWSRLLDQHLCVDEKVASGNLATSGRVNLR